MMLMTATILQYEYMKQEQELMGSTVPMDRMICGCDMWERSLNLIIRSGR